MRSAASILAALAAALALAGCAGDDADPGADARPATTAAATGEEPGETAGGESGETAPEEPSRLFTEAELAELALQPSDAPPGTRYVESESGPKAFEDVGIVLDDQVALAEEFGLSRAYDAIFDSTSSDLRVSSRLWLFEGASGADDWLENARAESTVYLGEIRAPRLAEGSWAAHGSIGGTEVISHGFRAGNVVVVVTLSSNTVALSQEQALAIAQDAAARVQSRA